MPTPSLILVPARFKTGKLYTPLATTSGGTVLGASGDFNVTRATTATRVNASGLIEVVASGVPRLDYYTSGGVTGCPALLVEPAATNLFSGSNNLSNTAYWTRPAGANLTGSVSGITSPDGTQNATLFQAAGTSANNSRIRQTWSRTTTGSHAMSVFVRGVAGVAASGFLYNGVGGSELNFAITSGGVVSLTSMTGGAAAVTSGIVNFGNGWYRITSVGTDAITGTTQSEIFCQPSGTGSMYIFGAQMEAGSVATSYIPTTSGSVTRNADVINLSGSVSGCIGQTEGTLYAEGVISNYADAAASFVTLSDNTITNRVEIRKGSPNQIIFERNSGTQSTSTSITLTGQGNGTFKLAVAYKSGDTAFFVNGVQVSTTNTATFTMDSLNHIYLGNNATGSARRLNDRIRSVALYTTRLTNAQLAALTT